MPLIVSLFRPFDPNSPISDLASVDRNVAWSDDEAFAFGVGLGWGAAVQKVDDAPGSMIQAPIASLAALIVDADAKEINGHHLPALFKHRGYGRRMRDLVEFARLYPTGFAVLRSVAPAVIALSAKPFSEAPNDGRELLLYCGNWVCGYFSGDLQDPERRPDGWVTDTAWSGMVWPPTHYADLPDVPVTKKA